ncbi:hypothetical protein ATE92_0416 [Ulvibacter sp. MAR_2010_11]|uniref:hypothetical protein n=1 Tax=Ulvibacter sp. MAR_2010_11 TaxID=1250229 RepID=UPI000C2BE060|nr:hypothetical protein [Ulvibacter sp. MAR_2010_11]PKA82288.1 hypothetical protein ATE92_0416 [Ulvibacter sp. MAR_2010_11]
MKSKALFPLAPFALVVFIVIVFSCDPQVPPPQQVISYQDANVLEENFKTTRAAIINDSLGYEDTREFWFSLDSLKKYIEYVEYEARQQGIEQLGLRVYFASYPQNSNYPDPGFATVLFVPTKQVEPSPIRQGFFPMVPINENIQTIDAFNFGHGGKPPTDL